MGFWMVFKPVIHILAGEKVCIHVMIPIQFLFVLASMHKFVISSVVFKTGLKTILTGISDASLNAFAIACELVATWASVSGPYKCWLPVTNQTSKFLNTFIF